jgi:hypothetical protein
MRTASQLQGVPERTSARCPSRSDIGMSVAHIWITDGITAGKEARARDNRNKSASRMWPRRLIGHRAKPDNNNEKTLLHTQASDRHPASRGVFFARAKAKAILSERPR